MDWSHFISMNSKLCLFIFINCSTFNDFECIFFSAQSKVIASFPHIFLHRLSCLRWICLIKWTYRAKQIKFPTRRLLITSQWLHRKVCWTHPPPGGHLKSAKSCLLGLVCGIVPPLLERGFELKASKSKARPLSRWKKCTENTISYFRTQGVFASSQF